MTKRIALLLSTGLLIAFGAIAVACGDDGGGGGLTLEEYFQRAVELDQEHEAVAEPQRAILDQSLQGLADEAALPAGAREALKELHAEEINFAEALSGLQPAAEAEDAHREAIDALQAEAVVFGEIVDQLNETTTLAQLNELFESEEAVQAEERRTSACLALQQLASDNNAEAALTC